MENAEEVFAKMALGLGGEQIKVNHPASTSINIFDFDKPEITEELLEKKERDLRAFLNEANKCYLQGSLLAVDYLDMFDELPGLNDNPEWKERARKILQEFAEQISIKNLRIGIGMSQSRFANYLEIPVRTLQEWEQGKRTPPSHIIKMAHKIIQLESEQRKTKEKVLVEQYTEKDYTMDQLIQIYAQKMKTYREDGVILEFIKQKPVFNENGLITGITSDFPAELNVYTYKVSAGVNLNSTWPIVKNDFFASNIETTLGYKKGRGKMWDFKNRDFIKKENLKNTHSGKMIVYGFTGFGKSYVIISNILRERAKAMLISANGDAAKELECMHLEEVDINIVEPEDFTIYDKVAIPKTGIPSSKMEEFFNDMLDKIESSGFANDEIRTIVFTGFHEGYYNKDFVDRLTKWKCQVVIEYMGGAKWVEEHEIPEIMKSKEWEKYPLYNSLRPGSPKNVPGLHFISGEAAKKFCEGLYGTQKGNILIEPRRLFGEDGFLIQDCDYVIMTAEEQATYFKKFMEMSNHLETTVKIRDL